MFSGQSIHLTAFGLRPSDFPSAPLLAVSARPRYIPDYATPRFRLTPRHLAYVKIAEGCNHPCSFCIIPRIRGSHRSRSQGDIVAEAKAIRDGGGNGSIIGRNTFQRPRAEALALLDQIINVYLGKI